MPQLSNIPNKVLVGPTAAGKTNVIHEIAHKCGYGIISADAMMIYKGMDIGTAKPTIQERSGLEYTGIDLVEPDQVFSVHDYLLSVETDASPGNREWIIAGGTGLYVRCLLAGLDEADGPSSAIREQAEQILEKDGFVRLQEWCRKNLPDIETRIPEGDRGNPRRWIRAAERGDKQKTEIRTIPPKTRIVGLSWDKADLERRIVKRVEHMYASGLLDEVKELCDLYPELSPTAAKAIGYAEAMDVLEGKLKTEEAKQQTIIRTRQYAKRQMTWFRNQFRTQWIRVAGTESISHIADQVMEQWELDE